MPASPGILIDPFIPPFVTPAGYPGEIIFREIFPGTGEVTMLRSFFWVEANSRYEDTWDGVLYTIDQGATNWERYSAGLTAVTHTGPLNAASPIGAYTNESGAPVVWDVLSTGAGAGGQLIPEASGGGSPSSPGALPL